MSAPLIVSASGIRGIVGQSMTPELTYRYGVAFGTWIKAGSKTGYVIMGRDSRTSGPELCEAASDGLREAGCDVRFAGLTATPSLLLAVKEDPAAVAGLIVTASHNPIEWNGLKLVSSVGRFLTPAEGERVQEILDTVPAPGSGSHVGDRSGFGAKLEIHGLSEAHLERILALELIDTEALLARGLKVALDCVHGAGGAIMPELLERLGCEVSAIGLETDGLFPRSPEPTADNLAELGRLVRDSGADIGLAVDPDVDRLSLVDEQGRAVGEDWTLAIAAEYVLSRKPGPVVTNLSSSQTIEDAAARAGVEFYRTPVGEIRVALRMADVGAVIGGEGNGGVMLPDLNLTRDAPAAAALVLSWLAQQQGTFSQALAERPQYSMARRKAARPDMELTELYDLLESEAAPGAAADRADGLRLAWAGSGQWIHVRPSGTEPIVRIYAEARDDRSVERLADWAQQELATLAGSVSE
ncbi:MAG: phosphoglucosamine mutase [Gemmatimonadota bacterium]